MRQGDGWVLEGWPGDIPVEYPTCEGTRKHISETGTREGREVRSRQPFLEARLDALLNGLVVNHQDSLSELPDGFRELPGILTFQTPSSRLFSRDHVLPKCF